MLRPSCKGTNLCGEPMQEPQVGLHLKARGVAVGTSPGKAESAQTTYQGKDLSARSTSVVNRAA